MNRRSSGIDPRTGLPQARCADVEAIYGKPHGVGDSTSERHVAINNMWAANASAQRRSSGIDPRTGLPQARCADAEAIYGKSRGLGESTSARHVAINDMWGASTPEASAPEANAPQRDRRSSGIDPRTGLPQARCADVEAIYGKPRGVGESTSARHIAINDMWGAGASKPGGGATGRRDSAIDRRTGLPQARCADVNAVYGSRFAPPGDPLHDMWAAHATDDGRAVGAAPPPPQPPPPPPPMANRRESLGAMGRSLALSAL